MSDQLSDEDIDALDTIATPMAAHGLMRIVAEVRRLRADLAMANSELTAAHASWQADVARLNAEVEQLRADLATSIDNREIEAERVVEARAEAGRAKDERASLTVELWEGVRAHGLTAPTEYRERSEGARLIHAYCGGIVRALEERDTAIRERDEARAALGTACDSIEGEGYYDWADQLRASGGLGVTVAAPSGEESTP